MGIACSGPSTPQQAKVTSKGEVPAKHEKRKKCKGCKVEFGLTTLQAYGGVCLNCSKGGRYGLCPGCSKAFTLKLLKKKGKCSRCLGNPIPKRKEEKKKLESKLDCPKCQKKFTKATLRKNGGTCKACSNSLPGSDTRSARQRIWHNHFGETGERLCPLCKLNRIDPFTFEKGHDIAKAKGGSNQVENFLPICRTCNTSQNTLTFDEFRKTLGTTSQREGAQSATTTQVERRGLSENDWVLVFGEGNR